MTEDLAGRVYGNTGGNPDEAEKTGSNFDVTNHNNETTQKVISVSDALRQHSGFVKVQGMISSLYPPNKMVAASLINCTKCGYSYNIVYEKPELAPRTVSKECPICKEETISISHKYINAVNVELQDTDSFSEIERLPVILFDEYTRDIHAGERVTIQGKIYIIKTGKKGKLVEVLFQSFATLTLMYHILIGHSIVHMHP